MIIYIPHIDRKAAMLAGLVYDERPSVDLLPSDFGVDWPLVAAQLVPKSDGSAILEVKVGDPTPTGIVAAIKAAADHAAKRWTEVLAEAEAAVAAYQAALVTPLPVGRHLVYGDIDGFSQQLGEIDGVVMPRISAPSRWDTRVDAAHREDPIFVTLSALKKQLESRVRADNQILAEVATPGFIVGYQRRIAEQATQASEKKAAKEAAVATVAVKRLETGYWEFETGSYNERRYGKPWCARVTGIDARGKLMYEWAEWTGRIGDRGLLRVACKPGEIIAWGQRDLRRPHRSEHLILQMQQDGRMVDISIVAAAQALRPNQEQVK